MTMIDDNPEVGYQSPADALREAAMQREEQIAQLASLGARLKAEFDQRVNDRLPVETRWLEDLRLYNCIYDPKTLAEIKANQGSSVFLSIGRTKTDAVEAHHSNLLLPTDDRNWEIHPTPMPEMAALEGSNAEVHRTPEGNPVTAADMVDAMREQIDQACDKMRETIDDQFVECNYPRAARRTLHQGCVLGTGVMRGPILKNKRAKKWDRVPGSTAANPVFQKINTTDATKRPAIENVNVWDFYPSSGIGDIKQSDGEFVRHWISRQQLRDLQYDVDFMVDEIEDLLRQHPSAPKISNSQLIELRTMNGETGVLQESFEMIEYVGMVDTADLLACGIELPDGDEPLRAYKASVFFVMDKPIKAALELMDGAIEKEFYVWQLAKDDTSIWGRGVPRLMRTSVLVANAVMRMMLDNAGLAVGGQLVYAPEYIVPADGNPNMTPRKVWHLIGGPSGLDKNINDVFDIKQVPVQLEWLMPLFNLAIRLCDEESALPMIAQGDQAAHVTKTKGGMSMLMDAAGVMLRRSIESFDDNITIPVVDAMYDWNMLYNPDPAIKGDYGTKARGSSALLEREAQMEAFTQFTQFLGSNPLFQKVANWPAILEEGARLLRINRGSLLLPVAKIKQIVAEMQANPQAQPDPRIQAAQITAQASEKRAEIGAQAIVNAAQVKAGVDQQEVEATMNQLAAQLGWEREKLNGMLGIKSEELDTKKQILATEAALRLRTGQGVGID